MLTTIIEIGDQVVFQTNTNRFLVKITSVSTASERPGFAGQVQNGPEKGEWIWGYNDQVVRIYKGYSKFFRR